MDARPAEDANTEETSQNSQIEFEQPKDTSNSMSSGSGTNTAGAQSQPSSTGGPVLANKRYGIEEMLALIRGTDAPMPEVRAKIPPFYVEKPQPPITMQPLSGLEQRLMMEGVSSSRAMSTAIRCMPNAACPQLVAPRIAICASSTNQSIVPPTPPDQIQAAAPRLCGIGRGMLVSKSLLMDAVPLSQAISSSGRGRRLNVTSIEGIPGLQSYNSTIAQQPQFAEEQKPIHVPAPDCLAEFISLTEYEPYVLPPAIQDFAIGNSESQNQAVASYSSTPENAGRNILGPDCEPGNVVGTADIIGQRWLYIAPDGSVQGPFEPSQMSEWFIAGFFTMEHEVRPENANDFAPLGNWIKQYGRVPFITNASSTSEKCTSGRSSAIPTTTAASVNIVHPTARYSNEQMLAEVVVENTTPIASQHSVAEHFNTSIGQNGSIESELASITRGLKDQSISGAIPQSTQLKRPRSLTAELRSKLIAAEKKKHGQRQADEKHQREATAEAARKEEECQLARLEEEISPEQEQQKPVEESQSRFEEATQRRKWDQYVGHEEEERDRRRAAMLTEEMRLKQLRECYKSGGMAPVKSAAFSFETKPVQQWYQPQNAPPVSAAKSLSEIQEEEERQMKAEKRQDIELALLQQVDALSHSVTASAPKKYGIHDDDEGTWTSGVCQSSGISHINSPAVDALTKWAIKQVKALNDNMNAEAFVDELKSLDSAGEIAKRILACFGDCGPSRDFMHGILEKRRQVYAGARVEKRPTATPMAWSKWTPQTQDATEFKKKSSGKPTKFVVDAKDLGFRPAGNRNPLEESEW